MKCPYCNSKNVQGTNVGARVFAGTVSMIAGVAAGIFGPAAAHAAQRSVNKGLCDTSTYICLDCKKTFSENR